MKLTSKNVGKAKIPDFLATHDSATGMLLALSDALKEKAFEGLGSIPTNEFYAKLINFLPVSWRKKLYANVGKYYATAFDKVDEIDASKIDKWVYDLYPEKKYPAIAIGSCNGAMIHLFAAMGIPWLPQTFLITIDKKGSFPVDEPKKTMEWAKEPARIFLQNNPGWQLHHMMDPNQDRLRVGTVGYFRIKKLGLGEWYKKFLNERLDSGGKIIIVDCEFKWPVCKIGERHFFQFGGAGGMEPMEYYQGSPAVKEFLNQAGTGLEKWDAPTPETEAPEAEWGLATPLAEDVSAYANKMGVEETKIIFQHPQDISAAVADTFRSWYSKNGESSEKLLVETFSLIAPFLSLKKQYIPYWLFFNVNNAAEDLERYLKNSKSFDEIYMMILSHGKKSKGITPISKWEALMKQAKKKYSFIGTTPEEYPVDLAVYSRYSKDLKEIIPQDHPFPEKMNVSFALELLQNFIKRKTETGKLKNLL